MRRVPLSLLVCCLALATGLALLGAGQAVTMPAARSAGQDTVADEANVDLVRRFYAAANTVLQTGDPALLDAFVSPALIEHPAALSDRRGLGPALRSLGVIFPGIALVVDDLQPAGSDFVLARLHATGPPGGTFAGLPISLSDLPTWGPIEVLRIAHGRIVERWTSGDPAARFEPLWRMPFFTSTGSQLVVIERLTFAPGAELAARAVDGAQALAIETGTLSVEAKPVSARAVVSQTALPRRSTAAAPVAATPTTLSLGRHDLVAGDLLIVPGRVGLASRNGGNQPATALWIMTLPAAPGSPYGGKPITETPRWEGMTDLAAGVEATVLTAIVLEEVPPLATLAVGRAVLTPGQRLIVGETTGPALLAVEEGRLDLAGVDGGAAIARAASFDGRSSPATSAQLDTGDGASLLVGSRSTWRTDGDTAATVLVVSLLPPT